MSQNRNAAFRAFVAAIVDRELSECARLSHGEYAVTSALLEAGEALLRAIEADPNAAAEGTG